VCVRTANFRIRGGSPPIYAGKERFSAPRNSLDSIVRFSAGNARAVLYALYRLRKTRFVSGHDFSRAINAL
jgi:hypothetical protein